MTTKKNDILNEYFTKFVNELLKQVGLDEIKPNELKDIKNATAYPINKSP